MAKKKRAYKKKSRGGRVPSRALSQLSFATAMKHIAAEADAIVAEIVGHMNVVIDLLGKSFTPTALNEWQPKLLEAVKVKLGTKNASWNNDRSKVKEVARDMTIIAFLLSGNAAQVSKGRVHAAFRACKDHASCPVDGGSGAWCNFNI